MANLFYESGVYEQQLEQKSSMAFLQSEPPGEFSEMTVEEIMTSPPVTVRKVENLSCIFNLLRTSWHNGFPVVGYSELSGASDLLVGFILRHQLLVLLEGGEHTGIIHSRQKQGSSSDLYSITEHHRDLDLRMRAYQALHNAYRRHLNELPERMEQLAENLLEREEEANEEGRASPHEDAEIGQRGVTNLDEYVVDIGPFMVQAPLSVQREYSAHRAHNLFRCLGLRHLCVTDANNRVCGVVTRKDFSLS